MTGQWTDMFDNPGRSSARGTAPPPIAADDGEIELDVGALSRAEYQPWVLQRGRPSMLLHLRRFEPRSDMWQGWALSYPTLSAVEYIGPRMVSLDFGLRQFVIEGGGLDGLVDRLQQGAVSVIQEYSLATWPCRPDGPFISAIKRVGPTGAS